MGNSNDTATTTPISSAERQAQLKEKYKRLCDIHAEWARGADIARQQARAQKAKGGVGIAKARIHLHAALAIEARMRPLETQIARLQQHIIAIEDEGNWHLIHHATLLAHEELKHLSAALPAEQRDEVLDDFNDTLLDTQAGHRSMMERQVASGPPVDDAALEAELEAMDVSSSEKEDAREDDDDDDALLRSLLPDVSSMPRPSRAVKEEEKKIKTKARARVLAD